MHLMDSNYQPHWRKEDEARVKRMDILYLEDWRHDPNHPQHGLYTGLHQKSLEKKEESINHESQE